MATIATLALAATAVSAVGSIVSGVQGNAAAKEQAKALRNQATMETRAATLEEGQSRREARRLQSAQLARFGKSGVTIAGTPSLVVAETAEQQERDALLIRFGGETRKNRLISEAKAAKKSGKRALFGGFLSAGTTLLGSGAFAKK